MFSFLKLSAKDKITGTVTDIIRNLSISGVSGTLSVKTEKDVYLGTEGIKAVADITSTGSNISDASLNIKVVPAQSTGTIKGTVIYADTGAAIPGAKVYIGSRETFTTAQGEYSLGGMPTGRF